MSAKLQDPKRRFLEKLEISCGHWLWRGTLDSRGRPAFQLEGGRGSQMIHPYRASYLLIKKQVVKNLRLQCDEPLCVKPEHWGKSRKKKSCNPYWGQHREGSS